MFGGEDMCLDDIIGGVILVFVGLPLYAIMMAL